MVSSFLFERFGITSLDAEVRRHEPEDFVVRFRHRSDRDRVLASPQEVTFFRWFGTRGDEHPRRMRRPSATRYSLH